MRASTWRSREQDPARARCVHRGSRRYAQRSRWRESKRSRRRRPVRQNVTSATVIRLTASVSLHPILQRGSGHPRRTLRRPGDPIRRPPSMQARRGSAPSWRLVRPGSASAGVQDSERLESPPLTAPCPRAWLKRFGSHRSRGGRANRIAEKSPCLLCVACGQVVLCRCDPALVQISRPRLPASARRPARRAPPQRELQPRVWACAAAASKAAATSLVRPGGGDREMAGAFFEIDV